MSSNVKNRNGDIYFRHVCSFTQEQNEKDAAKAKEKYDLDVARAKKRAVRLGITFDPASVPPLPEQERYNGAAHGNRACPEQSMIQIEKMTDLPVCYARRLWYHQRCYMMYHTVESSNDEE